ncbi:MAG: energy transducer TonB [Brevundimonas sp.]
MIRISTTLAIVALSLFASVAAAQTPEPKPAPQSWPNIGVTAYSPPPVGQGDTSMSNVAAPDFLRRAMPYGDIRDWIAQDDPIIALVTAEGARRERSGFTFDIGPDGRVTHCALETNQYTPPNPYTDGLCERMSQRMRFRPALNRRGEPTSDRYFAYVWFEHRSTPGERPINHQRLPPAPPAAPRGQASIRTATATAETISQIQTILGSAQPATSPRLRLEIDAAGAVSQCLVTTSSGDDAIDIALCRTLLEQGRFSPAQDGSGRPRSTSLYNWMAPLPKA